MVFCFRYLLTFSTTLSLFALSTFFLRFPSNFILFLGDLRSQNDIDQFLAPVFKLDLLRPVLGAAIDIAKGQIISEKKMLSSIFQAKAIYYIKVRTF